MKSTIFYQLFFEQNLSQKFPQISHEISLFLHKIVSEIPAKFDFFFHDLPEALFITKYRTVSRYFKYINCCIKFNERIKQCIVFLLFTFQKEEIYLNLVLDFVPETVYRVARHYSKAKQTIPILYIKVS